VFILAYLSLGDKLSALFTQSLPWKRQTSAGSKLQTAIPRRASLGSGMIRQAAFVIVYIDAKGTKIELLQT